MGLERNGDYPRLIFNREDEKLEINPSPSCNILWIEDDSRFLKNTIPLFKKKGLDITGIIGGERALEEIKKKKYSLVLLDLKMSGMDGIEAYKEIKKTDRNIPIMLVSAFLEEYERRGKLKNIDRSITPIAKPIPMTTSNEFEDIINRIKSICLAVK
jgi:CheY-like chemotaxis protein